MIATLRDSNFVQVMSMSFWLTATRKPMFAWGNEQGFSYRRVYNFVSVAGGRVLCRVRHDGMIDLDWLDMTIDESATTGFVDCQHYKDLYGSSKPKPVLITTYDTIGEKYLRPYFREAHHSLFPFCIESLGNENEQ